jgi:hypothetical protein
MRTGRGVPRHLREFGRVKEGGGRRLATLVRWLEEYLAADVGMAVKEKRKGQPGALIYALGAHEP